MSTDVTITDWQNCYEGGWQDAICPEAFSHPAKFSRALIVRIIGVPLSDLMPTAEEIAAEAGVSKKQSEALRT